MIKTLDFLKGQLNIPLKTVFLQSCDSTNNYCKLLSKESNEDLLVIALSQTAGKGRLGRSFYSPKKSGIYMSVLLHPSFSAEQCTLITTAAAVAASIAIDRISGKNSLIKWVNDIYLDGKKVCGILTEAGFTGSGAVLDYAVLGIGINLFDPPDGFPEDIKNKAGSVLGRKTPCDSIKAEFINTFIGLFLDIYHTLPHTSYMEDYRNRSLLCGKTVSFIRDGKEYYGKVQDINDKAELTVETQEGTVTLFAGEVSIDFT